MTKATPSTPLAPYTYVLGENPAGERLEATYRFTCTRCDEPAMHVVSGHSSKLGGGGSLADQPVSEVVFHLVFACDDHYELILDQHCDRYGMAGNRGASMEWLRGLHFIDEM